MGTNDAAEMLEVAKAEVALLEVHNERLVAERHTAFDDRDAALERLAQVSRLHEVATERLAGVRIALDRADERFAAREHGAVVMADFHADVSRAISEHGSSYSDNTTKEPTDG